MTDTVTRAMTLAERFAATAIDDLLDRARPAVPSGHVRCNACDGFGTQTYGYIDGQPVEDRCRWCNGIGHKPEKAS